MKRMDATRARQEFAATVNQVAFGRYRIVVSRRGKDLAALVPMDDLELIERCEAEEAAKARHRKASGRSSQRKRRAA
jgi:prevent-host-death family protein